MYTLGRLSQPPHLVNFDGHDVVFTEIGYPLLPDAAVEIERRLHAAPSIERDVRRFCGVDQASRRSAAGGGAVPGRKARAVLRFPSEDGRWTFARIELKPDALLLTCNSRERAEMAKTKLAGPLLRQFMDDHYRKCLNQPIGMLDGKTLRQAVRSKKGREQVVVWLKYLENGVARQARNDPSAAYDFTWM